MPPGDHTRASLLADAIDQPALEDHEVSRRHQNVQAAPAPAPLPPATISSVQQAPHAQRKRAHQTLEDSDEDDVIFVGGDTPAFREQEDIDEDEDEETAQVMRRWLAIKREEEAVPLARPPEPTSVPPAESHSNESESSVSHRSFSAPSRSKLPKFKKIRLAAPEPVASGTVTRAPEASSDTAQGVLEPPAEIEVAAPPPVTTSPVLHSSEATRSQSPVPIARDVHMFEDDSRETANTGSAREDGVKAHADLKLNWTRRVYRPAPTSTKLQDLKPSGGDWTVRDAWQACPSSDGKWVFTTPWRGVRIPEPIFGAVHIVRQWNGHFGVHDPLCWPQLYVDDPRFRWFCAVSRNPRQPDHRDAIIWKALTSHDIVPYSRAGVFGIVAQQFRDTLGAVVQRQRRRVKEFVRQNGDIAHLTRLHWDMVDAFDRLTLPSTEPDLIRQVACVQRFLLLISAWLEYHTRLFRDYSFSDPYPPIQSPIEAAGVRTDLMGAFTASLAVGQKLFRANVPVWMMREPDRFTSDDTVVSVTDDFARPHDLTNNPGIFPAAVVASEWAGPRHLSAIMCLATQTLDLELVPRPADISSDRIYEKKAQEKAVETASQGDVPIAGQPKKQKKGKAKQGPTDPPRPANQPGHQHHHNSPPQGRTAGAKSASATPSHPKQAASTPRRHPKDIAEKFEDRYTTFMPPCNPGWQDALKHVDRSRPAPPQEKCWDYWVPEPALLANAANAERSQRYAMAWLRSRPAWFWMLENQNMGPSGAKAHSLTDWKHYLNFGMDPEGKSQGDSHTAQKKREVLKSFYSVFVKENLLEEEEIRWRLEEFTGSEQQMREIVWELSDLGFRAELLQLDRALVPPPTDRIDRTVFEGDRLKLVHQVCGSRSLMSRIENFVLEGFSASAIAQRLQSLEGLRLLMSRWPNVPETIRVSPPLSTVHTSAVDLVKMETAICRHYCQTFWECAGRAATIPRLWPLVVSTERMGGMGVEEKETAEGHI